MPEVTIRTVDGRFIVKSPYRLKDTLEAIMSRRWDKGLKAWTYPATPAAAGALGSALQKSNMMRPEDVDCDYGFASALRQASETERVMNADMVNAFDTSGKPLVDCIVTPDAQTPQWIHQKIGHALIRAAEGIYLAWEMGTGKSKAIVDYVCLEGPTYTLIVCPCSVIDSWPREFKKHGINGVSCLPLRNGTIQKRTEQARRRHTTVTENSVCGVWVINYEAVWREPFATFVRETEWDLIVCDEIHRLMTPPRYSKKKDKEGKRKLLGGKTTAFFHKLAVDQPKAKRVGLSGTPMNTPMNLWAQMAFIDRGLFGESYYMFRGRFAVMGGYEDKQIVSYRRLDELSEEFTRLAHRVVKREVLDLPRVTHVERQVELCPTAQKLYDEITASFVVEVLGGEITVASALVELLRLQQLTGGHVTLDDGEIHSVDTAKRDALLDVMIDLPDAEPIVVFCRFSADVASVHEVAKKAGRESLELSGKKNQLEEWQAGHPDLEDGMGAGPDDIPTMLAVQIQAGGVGIDLTRARYCVLFSLGFSLTDYEQALARLDRHGQTQPVTFIHLIAQGTIDEKVYKCQRRKADIVATILKETKEDEHDD